MTPIRQAWDELATFTEGLRLGRVEGYPGLVEVKKMTQEEADHGIAVATALAEIWRAALACRLPDPELVGDIDDTDIVLDLLVALDRIRRTLSKIPASTTAARQKERIEALIEWHRGFTQGPIWCVRITLAFRALRETAERKAA